MQADIAIVVEKGGDRSLAEAFSKKMNIDINDSYGDNLTVVFGKNIVSLCGYGLSYYGDFEGMLHRITEGRLAHEMLVKASKNEMNGGTAIDATAGMGEDSLLLAAYGYNVILCEQNPVIALLLKDTIRRAKKNKELKDIANRMKVHEGNSIELMANYIDRVNLIYLDPMFPKRQKTGLINKKLQLIQKLEPPCSLEEELFEAALKAKPEKVVVKRPLKSELLANKIPNYKLEGKAIRYDCYVY